MKYLLPIILVAILGAVVYFAEAADTGAQLPTAAANDASIGTTDWATAGGTLGDALTDDANGPHCGCRFSGLVTETTIQLFVGGSPVGDDKAKDTGLDTGVDTYGGSSDLWGLTPTVSEVNAADFGVGISLTGNGGVSKYLYLDTFGFSVPDGATIDGILLSIDYINTGNPILDYATITVYYTEAAAAVAATASIRTGSMQVRSGAVNIR